ncbi:MAG: hypothetical protein H6656_05445, partial [Ardenticatenaceae bacterium]|nr:hypothetical protein [Ardenticatenaceae bacterium]
MKRFLQKQWVGLFVAYLATAVLVTWPLTSHLSSHLPDGTDSLLHYWNGWWSLKALQGGQLPYFTPYLFYPDGLSMVYHNFAWVHILMWLGLRPFTGGIAAYN